MLEKKERSVKFNFSKPQNGVCKIRGSLKSNFGPIQKKVIETGREKGLCESEMGVLFLHLAISFFLISKS